MIKINRVDLLTSDAAVRRAHVPPFHLIGIFDTRLVGRNEIEVRFMDGTRVTEPLTVNVRDFLHFGHFLLAVREAIDGGRLAATAFDRHRLRESWEPRGFARGKTLPPSGRDWLRHFRHGELFAMNAIACQVELTGGPSDGLRLLLDRASMGEELRFPAGPVVERRAGDACYELSGEYHATYKLNKVCRVVENKRASILFRYEFTGLERRDEAHVRFQPRHARSWPPLRWIGSLVRRGFSGFRGQRDAPTDLGQVTA